MTAVEEEKWIAPTSPIVYLEEIETFEVPVNKSNPMKAVDDLMLKMYTEEIALDESAPRNEKPPDLRLDKVSATGDLGMKFTSKMTFPDDILQQVQDSTERRRLKKRAGGRTGGKDDSNESWLSVELVYFPGVEDPFKSDIELNWKIESISEEGVDIKLSFADPLNVSQSDEPDFALVALDGFSIFVDE